VSADAVRHGARGARRVLQGVQAEDGKRLCGDGAGEAAAVRGATQALRDGQVGGSAAAEAQGC